MNNFSAVPSVQVIVGSAGNLSFMPTAVEAPINTIIMFNFLALNHTLTQSSFEHPCESINKFNTGYNQFNPANISGKYVIEYEVTSDKPQWFFCAQAEHCETGMVFALNAGNQTRQFIEDATNRTIPRLNEDYSRRNMSQIGQPPFKNLTELSKNNTSGSTPNIEQPPYSNITQPGRNFTPNNSSFDNTTWSPRDLNEAPEISEIPTISIPEQNSTLYIPANSSARSRVTHLVTFIIFIYSIGKEVIAALGYAQW